MGLNEIFAATNDMNPSCKLGEGASGVVFRGRLMCGTEVAIKAVLERQGGSLDGEIRTQSLYRHPHIVSLLGFGAAVIKAGDVAVPGVRNLCHAMRLEPSDLPVQARFLVFELVPGGDLSAALRAPLKFQWKKRLQAAIDICKALAFLHNRSPKVFHRDVKTANLLLTAEGRCKLTDFGLACEASSDGSVSVCKAEGTAGYADPRYVRMHVVSEDTEVYSLGMLLLELLTGRPPAVYQESKLAYFLDELVPGEWSSVLPHVQGEALWPQHVVQAITEVAFRCIDDEIPRPSASEVAEELSQLYAQNQQISQDKASEQEKPESPETCSTQNPPPINDHDKLQDKLPEKPVTPSDPTKERRDTVSTRSSALPARPVILVDDPIVVDETFIVSTPVEARDEISLARFVPPEVIHEVIPQSEELLPLDDIFVFRVQGSLVDPLETFTLTPFGSLSTALAAFLYNPQTLEALESRLTKMGVPAKRVSIPAGCGLGLASFVFGRENDAYLHILQAFLEQEMFTCISRKHLELQVVAFQDSPRWRLEIVVTCFSANGASSGKLYLESGDSAVLPPKEHVGILLRHSGAHESELVLGLGLLAPPPETFRVLKAFLPQIITPCFE
ncbi:MAG: hypothetical protein KVP17_001011 [Porospora cf. gigantea B]|uniref:uncharacterized protein n=1 Tax=Porospora cf. gigantea B TaxID=2853592 RepID=UPI003571CE4D|nr:MAG: hypothetical protein KVP17_001011 [Porospora cf. gigantea B]